MCRMSGAYVQWCISAIPVRIQHVGVTRPQTLRHGTDLCFQFHRMSASHALRYELHTSCVPTQLLRQTRTCKAAKEGRRNGPSHKTTPQKQGHPLTCKQLPEGGLIGACSHAPLLLQFELGHDLIKQGGSGDGVLHTLCG